MMLKLLVNAPTGRQEIVEVGKGGSYFNEARVLWDERVDGALPEITLGGMVRQGGNLVFDEVLFLQNASSDLVEARLEKWREIKNERDRRKAGGVLVAGKWFHSDDSSRIQQLGLVMMGASISETLRWKTMDGTFVLMTQALANQIFTAMAVRDQMLFAKAEEHKMAMQASADPAAYDFSEGWPLVYGEEA